MAPSQPVRLIVMGTGPFAVPMFHALLDSPHEVVALVTRPDRPARAKQPAPINPIREVAKARGLATFEPESINTAESLDWLRRKNADLLVVCDYGQILSREALGCARLGGINLHGSLLPKYRGAAPIQWAIYHGEGESGVTVIHMTPGLDAGPALVQRCLAIHPDETAGEYEPRLSQLGGEAVLEAIGLLARGESAGIPQDPRLATKAPRLKKTDGAVDWRRSAGEIRNQIRAFEPWPKTYTYWLPHGKPPLRLILQRVTVRPSTESNPPPGAAIVVDDGKLVIACGAGALSIDQLQPAGKRSLPIEEFLRGQRVQPGDRFGDVPTDESAAQSG